MSTVEQIKTSYDLKLASLVPSAHSYAKVTVRLTSETPISEKREVISFTISNSHTAHDTHLILSLLCEKEA